MKTGNGIENLKDSLSYLEKCIECLDQSLIQTNSSKAIESINLQKNHHVKQRDLILYHYEKYKKNEKQKLEAVNIQFNERVINSNKIQLDLFENIDNTDTLLEELKKTNPELTEASELQQMNSQLNVLLYQLIKTFETDGKSRTSEAGSESRAMEIIQHNLGFSPNAMEAQEEFAPLDLPVFDLESLDAPKN